MNDTLKAIEPLLKYSCKELSCNDCPIKIPGTISEKELCNGIVGMQLKSIDLKKYHIKTNL